MTKRLKAIAAACVAVAIVTCMCAGPAWAYFTDISTANGGIPVKAGPDTDIFEEFSGTQKTVRVHNNDTSKVSVFVRVGVFAPETMNAEVAGDAWTDAVADGWEGPDGLGWFYYGSSADNLTPVEPGGDTGDILVNFTFPKMKYTIDPNTGEKNYIEGGTAEYGDMSNVIVVYEATPVLYKDDGTAYADWSLEYDLLEEGE